MTITDPTSRIAIAEERTKVVQAATRDAIQGTTEARHARAESRRLLDALTVLLGVYTEPVAMDTLTPANALHDPGTIEGHGLLNHHRVRAYLDLVIKGAFANDVLEGMHAKRVEIHVGNAAAVMSQVEHEEAQWAAAPAQPGLPPAGDPSNGQAALTMVEDSVRAAAVALAGSTSPGQPGELEAPLEPARPLPVREPHAKPSATKAPPVIPGGPEDTGAWTLRRADELHLADPAGVAAVITKGNPQGDITPQEAADRARIAADGMADTAVMAPVPAAVAPPAPAPDVKHANGIADQGPRTHAVTHPKAAKPGIKARLVAAVGSSGSEGGND